MDEDTEYVKLPITDRCVHKLWKARVHGYEEAAKLFQQIDDEKSPEWNKFLGLVKKFVIDSNAVAQEKGLEAVLAFVENSAVAGKTVGEVMSGIVAKCIGAPKAKTKDLAAQISLMYIEIEKQEFVMEELMKGTEHKNPKIVSACISVMTQAIREFGIKAINIKPLVKKLPAFLEDRDKGVRDEGKVMVVEVYRWIGPALNPQLSSLKPVQMTELETEFEKVKAEKAIPTRYLRSQQAKQAKVAAEAEMDDGDGGNGDVDDADGGPELDPYDLMEPVDILSKLPKDFYEKLESKKWQERKEAMETLENLFNSAPKLENGDYFELVKVLKKIISKDTNVVVVALAGKNLASLATGLRKRFQQHACRCISVLLEKFKEKKANVVAVLREAIDASYQATTLEAIQDNVLSALDNKNPSVKSETALFLARCFQRCTMIILTKKLLKVYTAALLKTLNESDPTVRDNSAEALGTAMKVVGEKVITPFLENLDNLKMAKIKECCEKAEILVKQPKVVPSKSTISSASSGSDRPTSAPGKPGGSTAPKPVKRPPSSKKPGAGTAGSGNSQVSIKKGSSSSMGGGKSKSTLNLAKVATERELSEEEVQEKAELIFSTELLNGLSDSNWKTRLSSMEQLSQMIGSLDSAEVSSQVLFKVINKKPGVKDMNVQVAKLRLETVKTIATSFTITSTALSCILLDIVDKMADAKTSQPASECLTALAEATKLEMVSNDVFDYAMNSQKSPKVQIEVLNWLSNAILEFGFQVQAKTLMEYVKKGVSATNPQVRTAAISLLGTLYVYVGPQLALFFENEKPALVQQINAEFEKHAGETPRNPTRGIRKARSQDILQAGDDDVEETPAVPNLQDMVPRTDITGFITDSLISELVDKNWKVRAEALQKLQNIVNELKFISGNLGEAGPALAARLVDSNSKIAASTMTLCQSLGVAMGSSCKSYIRIFFPGFLQGMGDSKVFVRTAAVSCINTYGDVCGYKEFFDGEMIYDALKGGSPTLRSELWAWLSEKLPTIKSVPKEELLVCLNLLYSNVEDRNAEVRKNAGEAVVGFMIHLGYSPMMSACEKLKPASSSVVRGILDKARCLLPEKPAPMSKAKGAGSNQALNNIGGSKIKLAAGSSATITKSSSKVKIVGGSTKAGGTAGGKKKEEDVDVSPLLSTNNLKNQRVIDEQKLRTLKWNFTTPREEFVELLKDQMTTAGLNKGLIANMFHSDFKYHLRAIDSLNEDLASQVPSCIQPLTCNLDLILRWMTLRFFDTNPSVILKGLEYLQTAFNVLIDDDYILLESEAAAFIPYLVLKLGDPKDAVRNSVRAIFKQIGSMYPVTKLFPYIMDGLKSKNARQRTECLEQLGYLIETVGVTVCQPTPAAALKEIARHISDRDNSVRNGALNCVVAAYFLDGEKILKMVGQISDKDMSLLEERIKRAAKNRPVVSAKPIQHQQQLGGGGLSRPVSAASAMRPTSPVVPCEELEEEPVHQQAYVPPSLPQSPEISLSTNNSEANAGPIAVKEEDTGGPAEKSSESETSTLSSEVNAVTKQEDNIRSSENRPQPVSGPYGLDLALLENIESVPMQHQPPKLMEFDLHYLEEPSKHITSPPRLVTSTSSLTSKLSHPATIDWQLTQIANTNLETAMTAMSQVETILLSEKRSHLQDHIDFFVTQLVNQLVLLNQCNHPEVVNCYRSNFNLFMKLYNYPELSYKLTEGVIRRALDQLISLLTEKKLEMYDHTEMFTRVVNCLVIRILERSDRSAVVCALLKTLYDTINNTALTPLYQELVMKCLWKVLKMFPEWDKELDYDKILPDVHAFLRDYPSHWWKKQPSDTPLRTVKTVLHTMAKMRGGEVLVHVRRIRGVTPDAEITTYCNKLIRTMKTDNCTLPKEDATEKKENSKPRRMSKSSRDQLTEIFIKIGSKNETKEGLRLLYDFKQQYPEADIEPFLEKSTKFFQDYIQRGLQTIEMEHRCAGGENNVPNTTAAINKGNEDCLIQRGGGPVDCRGEREREQDDEDSETQKFMKRLRVLQAKAGWGSSTAPGSGTTTAATTPPKGVRPTSPSHINNDIDILPVRNSSIEITTESPERTIDMQNVESIRQRLERLKGASRLDTSS